MSTAIQIVEVPAESSPSDADQLGAEITELCSYIYAAEARLLTLIRRYGQSPVLLMNPMKITYS